jgi:hypothetical protein
VQQGQWLKIKTHPANEIATFIAVTYPPSDLYLQYQQNYSPDILSDNGMMELKKYE